MLSLEECAGVSACTRRMSDTRVFLCMEAAKVFQEIWRLVTKKMDEMAERFLSAFNHQAPSLVIILIYFLWVDVFLSCKVF
jgi:hypothetical protein